VEDFTKVVKPTLVLNGKISFARIADVTIIVADIPKWDDKLTLEYLEAVYKVGGGVSTPANVTVFLDDVLGAGQRKLAQEWTVAKGFKAAERNTMITDSLLIRGALTAYSWLTKTEAKAFAMKDHVVMCDWITQGRIAKAEDIHAALVSSFKMLGKKLP